ncbi:BatD family protein [Dyadobacter sp. NIV53]|uniref:BatD family protein n=1 Tax=Dyadobacter sp. NIV53 TaxID=2861765 RepID=UPI001E30DDB6|nr:BatD family protein [Dyadobacter sp. NIV53]
MGSKDLKIDEPFILSVVLKDIETRPSVIFPDIKGLEKRSKSATSSVNTIDGKKIVVQTISQEYFAEKTGKYQIPDFYILINGVRLKSEGTIVNFSSGDISTNGNVEDESNISDLSELDLNKEGVFLSVQADKKGVYIREGFALRISLYIAESAPVKMEFYEFNMQLQSILKQIRPANCWEENVGIEEIVKRKVNIRGVSYTEYMMYQAQFFPITLQDVTFPSVNLNMLVVENKGAVNIENKVIRSFKSKAVHVKVKPLPNHPLKDQVAVGQYHLIEGLSRELVYPGESVRYSFKIEGIGNIAAIPNPEIETNSAFDFYPPDVSQIIRRSYLKVSGEKSFDYFVVPRRDGTFPLSRYFQWVYFNPVTTKYDTLRSSKKLQVKGEDYKLGNLSMSGSLGLYDNLDGLDTTKQRFNYKSVFKEITNIIVIILLITMIWVFRKQ